MMAARSSGAGTPVAPSVRTCCEMTPRFFVRMTTLSDSTVRFESFEKSLSDTSSALASEWVMIWSSSSPEKSGRMGTATMPAEVTARYDTPQLGMLLLSSATLSPGRRPAPVRISCTIPIRRPTSA